MASMESHETVIDFLVNTRTITCTAAPRVWHFSAFHCYCEAEVRSSSERSVRITFVHSIFEGNPSKEGVPWNPLWIRHCMLLVRKWLLLGYILLYEILKRWSCIGCYKNVIDGCMWLQDVNQPINNYFFSITCYKIILLKNLFINPYFEPGLRKNSHTLIQLRLVQPSWLLSLTCVECTLSVYLLSSVEFDVHGMYTNHKKSQLYSPDPT